ncbi:MAG: flagellar motor protein MotB [Deltaproteobacteria bacterium]|nr:flagellar motor protein MotB [Deltaproteobacteria bacterium]
MAEGTQPIVIKRIKKVAGGHHGGAWKIAYADFVTAMMAFFLLMWLLSSKPEKEREEIARYFSKPLIEAILGTDGAAGGSDATPSVLPAAGMDLIVVEGNDMRGVEQSHARTELERREAAGLESLMREIERAIEADAVLRELRDQLLLDLTTEGLRIQIVDEKSRPMFESGASTPLPYTAELLRAIGASLNATSHKLSISGHTDATPFSGGPANTGNWELSAERANAARRELVRGGMSEGKVMRVVGLGAAVPLLASEPNHPMNRRIAIVVLNKATEATIARDGGVAAVRVPTNRERFALPTTDATPALAPAEAVAPARKVETEVLPPAHGATPPAALSEEHP